LNEMKTTELSEVRIRMIQLAREGYQCSQILMVLGLEARGTDNPDLVRAVGGLAGGCGEGSCTCGALTGASCLVALFAGSGPTLEQRNENYPKIMKDLVQWFWQTYGFGYGGIDCMAIREAEVQLPVKQRCWQIMEDVYLKVIELLAVNGVSAISSGRYAR
jgi:hypothetical protein